MESVMTRTFRTAGPRRWVLLLALAPLLACDGFDPQALLADGLEAVARSATKETARDPDAARGRTGDMDSIGPADAMRIYYQFIDDRGGVHFVDRLADVPEAWRDRVGFVEMDRPPPLTPIEARKTWTLSKEETATVLASLRLSRSEADLRAGGGQTADVVLYFAEWCGYCKKARAHLDDEGIDYEIRDVDIDVIARELREKTGRGGVPVLDYDGQVLRGYSRAGYDKAIRTIRG
jgi:glutaredoxin/uncharacterized protein YciU (UPF0263 family)